MSIQTYTEFLNENNEENWWVFPEKEITTEWFNKASNSELNRFLISFNDGQGDHSIYTYDLVVKLLKNSDRTSIKDLAEITHSEIIDEFYKDLELNGNSCDIVYFDGSKYLHVVWKD
jgi:hypothetical protein